jgi:ABC-2 type transport system permease protein
MALLRSVRANINLFFEGALLSYIALFHWLRPAQYLASKVIGPVGQILFFTFLGRFGSSGEDPSFYIIGNAVQLAALSGIFGVTFSIIGDRWNGTLPYLFGSPANRLLMFVGRAFIHIIDGSFGVVIGLIWGVILLGLDLSATDPIPLILVILLTTFSTSGLGLALGSLSLVTRNVMFVNNTAYFILLVLAGSNISIDRLPNILQTISRALPLTRGIIATRAIINGASISDISTLMFEELLLGTLYVLAGYTLFRTFERHAKRLGSLEVI